MRRAVGLVLVAMIVLAACDGASEPAVTEPEMVAVLTDLHLLAARAEAFPTAAYDSLRQAIYASHGLDSARFHAALDAYAEEPTRLRAVYDSVIVRLNAQSTSLRERRNEAEGPNAGE